MDFGKWLKERVFKIPSDENSLSDLLNKMSTKQKELLRISISNTVMAYQDSVTKLIEPELPEPLFGVIHAELDRASGTLLFELLRRMNLN